MLHCAMRIPAPLTDPLPRPQRTGEMPVATVPEGDRPWPSPYLAASVFLQPARALYSLQPLAVDGEVVLECLLTSTHPVRAICDWPKPR